jgi:hypothetical protein
MIDRLSRNVVAEAIRALAAGIITNDAFEERLPARSQDPAVYALFSSGAWFLYDDLHEHRLVGRYRLRPEARAEVARWVLFLKTDREYEWPSSSGVVAALWLVAVLATLGLLAPVRRHWYGRGGDVAVWPFHKRAHYDEAIKHPAYLTGAA